MESKTPLVPFQAGSPIMISGPTGSGKTYFTHRLLINNIFTEPVSHISIVFANKRDESQAFNLGKQLYPCSSKGFMEVYQDATSEVYGYLVIDCDPKSPWELKLRIKIFPGERTICCNINI